jgi:type II secretory pathway pseudopilin PulG
MHVAIASSRRRVRATARGEAGFTLIEVMVAAMVAIIVVSAAAYLFTQGSDSSLAAQRQSQLIAVADQQIENIRQSVKTNPNGFSSLAMSLAPAAGTGSTLPYSSGTHTDPNDFVSSAADCGTSGAGYLIEANYNQTSEGPAPGVTPWAGCTNASSGVAEPLVVQSGGIVAPKQTNIPLNSGTATVYTYVTDTYIGCNSSVGSCSTSTGDARRVIVAVVADSVGRNNVGPNAPVYIATIFTSPIPSNQVNSSIGLTLGVNIG